MKTKLIISLAAALIILASGCSAEVSERTVEASVRTTSQGTPIVDEETFSIETERTPGSSCFSEIGYDNNTGDLIVTFRDSGVSYVYGEVPKSVWEELKSADSMGSYYNKEIKGSYDCVRLD